MNQVDQNIEKCQNWLKNEAFPLWFEKGIDRKDGGFVENLSFNKDVIPMSRRAMVQSRQIYSFLTGARMGAISEEKAEIAIHQGVDYLLKHFSLPSGAFAYSIDTSKTIEGSHSDLYTQAFALFALAQSYRQKKDDTIKQRALKLMRYLDENRSHNGGYTEIDAKLSVSFKSNPHMHLFESAIAWLQVDPDEKTWKNLASALVQLCEKKFVAASSGLLAEYFNADWQPLKEMELFVYEPGHQYEWAWLLSVYQDLTGHESKKLRHQLFHLSEKYGTSRSRKIVYDEMWSDFTPKTTTSRFWPQGERIKAAAKLGTEVAVNEQAAYAFAADEALITLFKFLETPTLGFWYDRLSEDDKFSGDFSKSSSLYHIINAMEEYIIHRPKLKT